MDALRDQPVVHESDIFTALFARDYTPKTIETRSPRGTNLPRINGKRDRPASGEATEAPLSQLKIPSLSMLSLKTPRSLMTTLPMTVSEGTAVWKFLADWVKTQMAMEAPAAIPGLGTITLRTQTLKMRVPIFEPDRNFLNKYGLRTVSSSVASLRPGAAAASPVSGTSNTNSNTNNNVSDTDGSRSVGTDVLAFSYLEMASCCMGRHTDVIKAQEWLQLVVEKVGEVMQNCQRVSTLSKYYKGTTSMVELDLGVGVVVCVDRVLETQLLPRYTHRQAQVVTPESHARHGTVKLKLHALGHTAPTPTKQSYLFGKELGSTIQVRAAGDLACPGIDTNRPMTPTPPQSDLLSLPNRTSIQTHQQRQNAATSRGRIPLLPASPSTVRTASPRSQQFRIRVHRPSPQLAKSDVSSGCTAPDTATPDQPSLYRRENPQADRSEQSSNHFVPLFDPISRTFCVEPDLNFALLQPSNRIASNYTPSAASIVMQHSRNTVRIGGKGISLSPMSCNGGTGITFASEIGNMMAGFSSDITSDVGYVDCGRESGVLSDTSRMVSSDQAYFQYIHDSQNHYMDIQWLAPLSTELVERIVASAIKYLNTLPSGHMLTILANSQQEFVGNYNISVKKAILDYILRRPATRCRLHIEQGTPKHTLLPTRWAWGDSTAESGCLADLRALVDVNAVPVTLCQKRSSRFEEASIKVTQESSQPQQIDYRKRVKLRLTRTLVIMDPSVRALHYMWYEFEASISLVKLPDITRLSKLSKPPSLQEFERDQLAYAVKIREYLMEHWYARTSTLFEQVAMGLKYPLTITANMTEAIRLKHMIDSVAVQMSLQLRSLITNSVQAYVDFFELFAKPKFDRRGIKTDGESTCHPLPQQDVALPQTHQPQYSAFLLELTIQDGEIQFKTTLGEVPSLLLAVLHAIPQLFYNVNRIETHFETAIPLLSPSSPFLWNLRSQDPVLVEATIRIREIIEENTTELRHLQTEYVEFARIYRDILANDGFATEEACSIEECATELKKVRTIAEQLSKETRSRQHLRLFTVDCREVNRVLMSAFTRWITELMIAFSTRTMHINGDLRQQYKDVAGKLSKRPVDLYELIQSEAFVDLLKTRRLQELQDGVEVVKERMHFLLFNRHPIDIINQAANKMSVNSNANSDVIFQVPKELISSTAKTIRWRAHIERLLIDAEAALVDVRSCVETVFLAKRNRFQAELEEFRMEVKAFAKKGDLRHAATYVVQLVKMKEVWTSFRRQTEEIQEEERKLEWDISEFSVLDDIVEEMEPYELLWKTAREFRELSSKWMRANIFDLPAQEGLLMLQHMMSAITTVSNTLKLRTAGAAITAEMVKKQIGDFRQHARLVSALLNPCIQPRHLKEVSVLLTINIDPHEPITLLRLLEQGALQHLQEICTISENATHERQIEDALREIAQEWHGVYFQFKTKKRPHARLFDTNTLTDGSGSSKVLPDQMESGCHLLLLNKATVEDIQLLIGDHQLRLQSLQWMPHSIPFAPEITTWLSFIQDVQDIVELLADTERVWLRLEPLFSAHIIDESTNEAKQFAVANGLYQRSVKTVLSHPRCLDLIPRIPGGVRSGEWASSITVSPSHPDEEQVEAMAAARLISDLMMCRKNLELVKQSVHVGFEARRSSFPRFYLLTDAELVTVLACCPTESGRQHSNGGSNASSLSSSDESATVESPVLWRHLARCFPGIHRVQINTEHEITAIVSSFGEVVPIGTPISTQNIAATEWLRKIETSTSTVLQACIRAAVSDFARKEFRKWCLLWPEQVLLTTVQHAWTMQGELANRTSTRKEALAAWQLVCDGVQDKLTAVTRELKAAFSPSVKCTLSNVISLLNHLRDVSLAIRDEVNELPVASSASSQDALIDAKRIVQKAKMKSVVPGRSSSTNLHQSGVDINSSVQPPPLLESMSWLAQPRYYYDFNSFGVRVLSFAQLPYGFEYWGNSSPSILITPLTLRCFHMLVHHASMLHRGSYVHGSPGSGKVTTCRTLARICGRLWVHMECFPSMDEVDLSHFITATASCGAWMLTTKLHCIPLRHICLFATICAQVLDSLVTKQSSTCVLGEKVRIKRGTQFFVMAPSYTPLQVALQENSAIPIARKRVAWCFRVVEFPMPDIDKLAEFCLAERGMRYSLALSKLIYAALSTLSRGLDLLAGRPQQQSYEDKDGSMSSLVESLLNLRTVKKVVARAIEICSQENNTALPSNSREGENQTTTGSMVVTRLTTEDSLASCAALIPSDAMSKAFLGTSRSSVTGELMPPPVVADTVASVKTPEEQEKMEHRAVCIALRELAGALIPAASHDWIEHLLRDCAPYSLIRELRVTRSFTVTPRRSALGLAMNETGRHRVEDAIEGIVRTTEPAWLQFGPAFSQKAVQLYQRMRTERCVVLVGTVQSGKTSVYRALARATTQLHADIHHQSPGHPLREVTKGDAVIASTRCVVILPRALTLDHMFGSDIDTDADTLFVKLFRGAKMLAAKAISEDSVTTWLVLDGDVGTVWADAILRTLDHDDTDQPQQRKPPSNLGLMLPTGKRLLLPKCMRILIETTTLKDISPSLLTKVGVVNLDSAPCNAVAVSNAAATDSTTQSEWQGMYLAWKRQVRNVFHVLEDELFPLLDELIDETVPASLEYIGIQFHQSWLSLRSWRFRCFLAMLDSSLHQSWAKISAMVSGKQRKTAIHCYFLQALVWGIGYTTIHMEQQKYHTFLHDLIAHGPRNSESSLKRTLLLFFPANAADNRSSASAGGISGGTTVNSTRPMKTAQSNASAVKETIYHFAFSVEYGQKWLPWTEFYEQWVRSHDEPATNDQQKSPNCKSADIIDTKSTPTPSMTEPGSTPLNSRWLNTRREPITHLFVPTVTTAASICVSYQLMAAGYLVLLVGDRGTAKTITARTLMKLVSNLTVSERINSTPGSSLSKPIYMNIVAHSDSMVREGMPPNEHVYMGANVTAANIVEQLETFIERRRVSQQRNRKYVAKEPELCVSAPQSLQSSMLVFFDDLHCAPASSATEPAVNSALEILRSLVEHRQLVHQTANVILDCSGLVPFAALQMNIPCGGDGASDLLRVAGRFVRIGIAPLTDAELVSICSTTISGWSTITLQSHSISPENEDTVDVEVSKRSYHANQEVVQLQSMVAKATSKLFRILTSGIWNLHQYQRSLIDNNGNTWKRSAHDFSPALPFRPSKTKYVFHMDAIFQVLRSVCLDTNMPASLEEKSLLARLWCHESARVFADRLEDTQDCNVCYTLLHDIAVSHFNVSTEALAPPHVSLESPTEKGSPPSDWLQHQVQFSFIGDNNNSSGPDGYREVSDIHIVEQSLKRSMTAMHRTHRLSESLEIVLCKYVIRHVLRLTRVLRHVDQHLLLIGNHGTKMRTLTRISTFICRKRVVTFLVPRRHDHEPCDVVLDAWKASLKETILRSVRHREESIVFVVKDIWLEHFELYATLDRYLSGSHLLSDVISYVDLDDEIIAFLRDSSEQGHGRFDRDKQTSQSTESTEIDNSRGPGTISTVLMFSKHSIMKRFYSCVRRRFQLVIILSAPALSRTFSHRMAQLFATYPYLEKRCTIDYFAEMPRESLLCIAEKCFTPMQGTGHERVTQLSHVAVQMYLQTKRAWRHWSGLPPVAGDDQTTVQVPPLRRLHDRPSHTVFVNPSMLVEQIALFVSYLPRLQRAVETNKSVYTAGLKFIEQTEEIMALEQTHQQVLQPEMRRQSEVARQLSGNLEKEKLMASKLAKALDMETGLVASQKERLAQVEQEYEELIRGSRAVFDTKREIMKKFLDAVVTAQADQADTTAASAVISPISDSSAGVSGHRVSQSTESSSAAAPPSARVRSRGASTATSLEIVGANPDTHTRDSSPRRRPNGNMKSERECRSLITSLKASSHIPTAFRQLAVCLGVIFNIEPVEFRDELDPDEVVMDYWESLMERMEDAMFWSELVHFDVRKYMSEKVVARLLPISQSPDFDLDMYTELHELAGVLCDWVQACVIYSRDFVLAEPKHGQLCHERDAYEAAVTQLAARKDEIEAHTNVATQASAMRSLSDNEQKNLEDRLKDNASTLHMTQAVWKVLESSKARWRRQYESFTEKSVQTMGDLMLATALIAYATSLSTRARSALRQLWSTDLNDQCLIHAPHPGRSLQDVFMINDRAVAKWEMDGLPRADAAALDNAMITTHSYHIPVLIDAYGVASNWLAQQEALHGGHVISASTTSRDDVWQHVMHCLKKQQPLVIQSVDESLIQQLLPVLEAKRRARFDAVNRDLCNGLTSIHSPTTGTTGKAEAGSEEGIRDDDNATENRRRTTRRLSTSGLSLGATLTSESTHENYWCWFEMPSSMGKPGPMVKFGSATSRLYLVYSSSDEVPMWMGPLSGQLTFVRFEFSSAHFRSQCTDTILAMRQQTQAQMEMQTLRSELVSCQEQKMTVEDEILEMFESKEPALIYGDPSEAAKVVANRNALHTLEAREHDLTEKIQQLDQLRVSYDALVARSVDIVSTWRALTRALTRWPSVWPMNASRIAALAIASPPHGSSGALRWVLRILTRTVEQCDRTASVNDMVTTLTTLTHQSVSVALCDDERHLFEYVLAFHVNQRRVQYGCRAAPSAISASNTMDELVASDVILRWLTVMACEDEKQLKRICTVLPATLLNARPDTIPDVTWRTVCYVAEVRESMKSLILDLNKQSKGKSAREVWRDAFALDELDNKETWQPRVDMDSFTRLCFVCLLQRHRFQQEINAFTTRELFQMAGTEENVDGLARSGQSDSTPTSGSSPLAAGASFDAMVRDTREAITSRGVKPREHLPVLQEASRHSSVSVPVISICQSDTEFVRTIVGVALSAGATADTSCLGARSLDCFEDNLMAAIKRGRWVILPDVDARPDWLDVISRKFAEMTEHNPHSEFRLWMSLLAFPLKNGESQYCSPIQPLFDRVDTTVVQLGGGVIYSLKHALIHTLSLLQQHRGIIRIMNDNLHEQHGRAEMLLLIKRVAMCHALLTSREHFRFDYWKTHVSFTDDQLESVADAVAQLYESEDTRNRTSIFTSDEKWAFARASVAMTYGSKLECVHDRVLVTCLVDFFFSADVSPAMNEIISKTLPLVRDMIRTLARSSWSSIINVAHNLSTSTTKEIGNVTARTSSLQPVHQHYGGRCQNQKLVNQFVRVFELKLDPRFTNIKYGDRNNNQSSEVTSQGAMEALARFAVDLASYALDDHLLAGKCPYSYAKPLNWVLHHEAIGLRAMRRHLSDEITQFQAVYTGAAALHPSMLITFEAIRQGVTPPSWNHYLLPADTSESVNHELQSCILSLDLFISHVQDRYRYFSAWVELGAPPVLAMDKFQSSESVLVAIHQHFTRNHVGSALCDRHCVKVVRIHEDNANGELPIKHGETLLLSGCRLYGHLQLDAIPSTAAEAAFPRQNPSSSQRARPQTIPGQMERILRPEGFAVILEVTTSCLSASPAQAPPTLQQQQQSSSRHLMSSRIPSTVDVRNASEALPSGADYSCPIYRARRQMGRRDLLLRTTDGDAACALQYADTLETSITVVSTLPLAQLALSGSALRIASCLDEALPTD